MRFLTSVQHLRITRTYGLGTVVYSSGVLVHCPRRLAAAGSVLVTEVQCGDGVPTMWTGERGHAVRHFDGVMSHSFKSSRLSRYGSEPKLPLTLANTTSRTHPEGL